MGIILNASGDQAKARQCYLKVVELDPNNGDAYFYLGYLSESQGELSEAVNYYEKAVEVAPKNAEAYFNLGNVYASLGQNGEAIASYLKTVGINPRHQDAYVNLSVLSFKSRDFQGAIHYLEAAQTLGYNPPAEYLKTLEPYKK
jgi:superkiller protein 3